MRLVRTFWALPLVLVCALLGLARTAEAQSGCPPKTGTKYKVKIDSAPQGATVYIGDKSCGAVGATPFSGTLAAGSYTVILESPGYELGTRSFRVARLRTVQELFVPMVKKAEPPKIDVRADADKNLFGAQLFLDGQPQGQVPMQLVTTPGRHLLEIKKDGFETLSQWIDAKENQVQTLSPTLKEIAKPKYGTIIVDADVPDAEVSIDGNKHPDNTPAVINNVIEGVHVIEVKKPPGLPWRQTVQVTANQQTKVRAELAAQMSGGVGVIRVLSDAQGARALIDGTDMGPVPVDIKDVKAGEHIVQVKAPGFTTGEKKVVVAAGGSQIVKFDLNPEAAGDQGIIKVVSSVPDAQVFIDGASVGKVPQEKKLSAGEHPVVVRLEGYKQFEQKVRIEPGQTVTVQADLKGVGRLRILSTPAKAAVLINGVPVKDKDGNDRTPLDIEVETGETVVRIESAGFQPFEQTLTIEGGKTQTISRELATAGKSDSELLAEQRGLSSYGARTLPRGRSTVDFSAGYPYFLDARITVGAGKVANKFGFDANVAVRTMLARSELGLGGRMMVADNEPFSAALFTELWWGSKLLDDSARNGVTWDIGLAASLTALSHVTITGRAHVSMWSDRHCPDLDSTKMNGFETGDPIQVCEDYKNDTLSVEDKARVESLTGNKGNDFFGRDGGIRLLLSVAAEIAVQQRWNVFGILEGAPFQEERPLFTNTFSGPMFDSDFILYLRLGISYKF
ncbi:MAG: PEGA domain-containing protein [Deltaproteobacteria bacterium]|nr:PEGA domain-containing protein [Deltaproteobacteria bacterium]